MFSRLTFSIFSVWYVKLIYLFVSTGIKIVGDKNLSELADCEWDLIALPGGEKGNEEFLSSDILNSMLINQHAKQKLIGAICCAPGNII